VAPLVVASFDGVPVSGVVANVLAAPAAALVMTWGLPAGVAAGLVPAAATVLHLPTRCALAGLAAVAQGAARAPLGRLGWIEVGALAVAVAVPLLTPHRAVRSAAAVLAVAALAAPGVALRHPPPHARPAPGVEVWRSGATIVVVAPGTGPTATLEGLRLAGVTAIDLLVVGPGSTAVDEEAAARHRTSVRRVWRMGRGPPAALRLGALVATSDGHRTVVGPAP
jgi:competence protein ComEC